MGNVTGLGDTFSQFCQSTLMALQEIRTNVKISNHNLTPSEACQSTAEESYTSLMESLALPRDMNLRNLAVPQPDSTSCPEGSFTFAWGDRLEQAAYTPLLKCLKDYFSARAVDISSGAELPHGHFFKTAVHTLRPRINISSAELRLTGKEPRLKFTVTGRSDIAVLRSERSILSRTDCIYCIEVKRVADMKGEAKINMALREGVLQLIGLNAANSYASPSVIVTNLNQLHYLIFICRNDEAEMLSFSLSIHKFDSIFQAVYHARLLSRRGCVTHLFGSAPTPPPSERFSEDDEEGVVGSESKVQVVEVYEEEV